MKILNLIQRQSQTLLLIEAAVLLVVIGLIDMLSGYEVSVSLFYGLPILAAVWFCGKREGILIAVIAGIVWWWADVLAGHVYSRLWVAIWEPSVRFGYFSLVAFGGAALKGKADAVQARITLLEHSQRLEREIIEISEREQRRIGRDLHDGLCQFLAAIGCAAASLRSDLLRKDLPNEATVAGKLTELLEEAVLQTRELARGLVPVPVDDSGLAFALEGLATSVTRLQNVDCHFAARGDVRMADPAAATHLYRIAQEAINNATRHGGAARIDIEVASDDTSGTLTVTDNGRGISKTRGGETGLGLSIMTYRARLLGGDVVISEPEDGGTSVTCTFPQHAGAPAEEYATA